MKFVLAFGLMKINNEPRFRARCFYNGTEIGSKPAYKFCFNYLLYHYCILRLSAQKSAHWLRKYNNLYSTVGS